MTPEEIEALKLQLELANKAKADADKLVADELAKNELLNKSLLEKDEQLKLTKEEADKIKADKLALEELAKKSGGDFETELARIKAESEKNDITAKLSNTEKSLLEKDNLLKAKDVEKEDIIKIKDKEIEMAKVEATKNKLMFEKSNNKYLVDALKNASNLAEIELAVKTLDKPELVLASEAENNAGNNALGGYIPSGDPKTFLEKLNTKLDSKQIRF